MRVTRLPAFVLAFAVAAMLLAPAGAEDDPTAAFAAAADALPAPSAAHALDFEGAITMNGKTIGTATFRCKPVKGPDGAVLWLVSESQEMGEGLFVQESTATLDAKLQPIRGKKTAKEPGVESLEIWWERTETGFKVKRTITQNSETKVEEQTVEHPDRVTTTLTSLLLFSKMTLPRLGAYASLAFDPDPDEGEDAFVAIRWTVGVEGKLGDRPVLLVTGTKGDKVLKAYFEPETHTLLGVDLGSPTRGFAAEIRPGEAPKPPAEDDLYARPAQNAQEAAMQAGLAFATGDVDLLMRIVHWTPVYEQTKAEYEAETAENPEADPYPSIEEFKAIMRAQFEQDLPKNPRPMIEMALKTAQPELKLVEQNDGTTLVRFPEIFRSLELTVVEVDGVWLLARFPD